jgi:hypothetical protein
VLIPPYRVRVQDDYQVTISADVSLHLVYHSDSDFEMFYVSIVFLFRCFIIPAVSLCLVQVSASRFDVSRFDVSRFDASRFNYSFRGNHHGTTFICLLEKRIKTH